MIKAKKVLEEQDKKVLKTTNFPEIIGVVYKLKGEIWETLYVSYDGGNLIYVWDKLRNNLSQIKTKEKDLKELNKFHF